MIEFTDEQKKAVAEAQSTFTDLKNNSDPLNDKQLSLLFGEARSMNGWQDKEVSDDMVKSIYELTKMGPTSTNCCPARFKFIKSDDQKQLLKDALLPNNIDKVMSAPVIAIIGYDLDFSDNMGKLFPHMDIAPMYKGNAEFNQATAFRNSSLQGAYFMMVSRALGLDCGPMSGFNNDLVDKTFLKIQILNLISYAVSVSVTHQRYL